MNKSGIEWCDYTWNPVTGCRHGCPYCFARQMARRFSGDTRANVMAKGDYRTADAPDGSGRLFILDTPMENEAGNQVVYPFGFEPTLHGYRLDRLDTLGRGQNIFVGAMADLFGEWVPDGWIERVFAECWQHSQHNYLFLTKNPERYDRLDLPPGDNFWFGWTVTGAEECYRHPALPELTGDPARRRLFVSIEPLQGCLGAGFLSSILPLVDWVIIGAETGTRKGKTAPEKEWVDEIAEKCSAHYIPVFMKDSLEPVMGAENMLREFPGELMRTRLSAKMQDRLYAECCECGKTLRKSEMLTLLARTGRGEQPRQYGWMCKEDFRRFCGKRGLEIPGFDEPGEDKG